jgi:hypothetical protein
MKITISENRLEQLIFKFLDVKLKDLEQSKGMYYDIVFRFPDEEYGILGWDKSGKLYIYRKLIDNIFSFIPIEKSEIQKIIGRYVEDRYNLEVRDTVPVAVPNLAVVGSRYNLEVIN